MSTALAPPGAQVAIFSNGHVLPISWHSENGESVVLRLRGGGELVSDSRLLVRIEAETLPVGVSLEEPSATKTPSSEVKWSAKPYAELVEIASERHGVDPRLVYALIEVESGYESRAESPKGARGLMQLMPATLQRYTVLDPFDPEDNINAGTRHLRTLLDEFGTKGALAAYNAGEGPVRRFDGIPPYQETREYVSRVLEIVDAQELVR